jgi:hypothetical protein
MLFLHSNAKTSCLYMYMKSMMDVNIIVIINAQYSTLYVQVRSG